MSIAWVGHVVGSAVVHALVYILAWRLLHHASIVTVVCLLILVVVALLVVGLFISRRRW